MEEYQKRVIEEQKELQDKIIKLDGFINHNDEKFIMLDKHNQDLLKIQLYAMRTYYQCLLARIKLFDDEKNK